jgi:hypothetical protein
LHCFCLLNVNVASSLLLIKLLTKSFMQNYLLNKRRNRGEMVSSKGMTLQKDHGLKCCTI